MARGKQALLAGQRHHPLRQHGTGISTEDQCSKVGPAAISRYQDSPHSGKSWLLQTHITCSAKRYSTCRAAHTWNYSAPGNSTRNNAVNEPSFKLSQYPCKSVSIRAIRGKSLIFL